MVEVETKEILKAMLWRTEYYGAQTEGGTASLTGGFVNGLLKLGHKCSYVSSGKMILPDEVNFHLIRHNKFLRNLPEILNLPYNNRAIKQIKKIIEKEEPDFLLQYHHDFNYGGAILKRDLGLPFLLHCDGVEYWIKKNWGKLYFGNLLKWAEEIQWESADAIFVPSKVLKDSIVTYGVDADKIVVNPNAVDPEKFSPDIDGLVKRKELGIDDKFVCGFVGTFGKWHGLTYFAKALEQIKKLIPNIMFLFVGDGDLRPEIDSILDEIDKKREFSKITGLVPYTDIPQYMAACDILISPCISNDEGSEMFNSPIKLFEYMGMQKPIIASRVGQQNDIFTDKENAVMIDEKRPDEIVEAIELLYKDNNLRNHIALNARKDVVEKYNWKITSGRFVKAYREIMAKRSI